MKIFNNFEIIKSINFLISNISFKKRIYLLLIICVMLVSAIAEILSIGAIIPFISIIFNISDEKFLDFFYLNFNLVDFENIRNFIIFSFCLLVILAGLIRILLIYLITNFSYNVGNEISVNLFKKIIFQKYEYHIINSSSETISNISQKVNIVISQIFLPVLTLISTSILFIFIFIAMMIVDYEISLTAFICFFFIYLIIILLTKNFLKNSSQIISSNFDTQIKVLQESILGIKDIILTNSQNLIISNFKEIDFKLRKYQGLNQFITSSPRFLVKHLQFY